MKRILECIAMILLVLIVVFWSLWIVAFITSPMISSKKHIKLEVRDWAEPDMDYLKYYDLDDFKTSLPVVFIDTYNAQITKENKIWSQVAVKNRPVEGKVNSILEVPDVALDAMIKYRGASSYSQFDKKQYRIKFYQDINASNDKDYAFLGMGENSEWILNGPFLDKTLMRNKLVYDLGREIFEWAPDTRYCELFVNGEYQGVYLAVEPVSNGVSRLRLEKYGLLSGQTAYIVKRDRVGTEVEALDVFGKLAGYTSNELYVEYPSSNKLTNMQKEWIAKDISEFEKALYLNDFSNRDLGYEKYIDVDSFVDYFILNEVVMNHDAGNLSTYAYKALGGKLKLAIWDYNNCYDNYQWFTSNFEGFETVNGAWFSRLVQDRNFIDKVVQRYRQLRCNTLSEEHMLSLLDQYQEELGEAINRNYAVWGYSFGLNLLVGQNKDGTSRDISSYEEAVEQLERAIHVRFEYLDAHIEDLYKYCEHQ